MKILEISNRKAWVVTMGEIIEIESNLPHEVQEVVCLKCLHRWIAAYPSRTWLKDLQCKCGEVGYVIATGQIISDEDLK